MGGGEEGVARLMVRRESEAMCDVRRKKKTHTKLN